MTHYDVLGVARTATDEELRAAYLGLVRAHHPDRHARSTPEDRARAEDRMRLVNQAWWELRDPDRRRRYDDLLDRRPRAVVVEPEETAWHPLDDGFDDLDDRLDDSHRPPPRGGRLLTMAPPVVLSVGFVLAVVGFAVGLREVLAIGVMAILLGAGLFVVVPLSVILESRHHDLG
ncbi:MAG: J domain-containing protein [Acidimicrobiales bacterium]